MNQNLQLDTLLQYWGLKTHDWEKIKDVYKVQTDQGVKNLKISPLKPKRLLYVHHAIAHLIRSGFTSMVPYLPTLDGRTYVVDGMNAYTLFDWIEGRQCDFQNCSELVDSTRIFADFHQKTKGFLPPPGANQREQLGKWARHFVERHRDLQNFKRLAKESSEDPFAELYLKHADFYLEMAEQAIAKIERTAYDALVAKARETKHFCHGDPAARNFIIGPDHRVFMIDFDSCRLDLPLMDLIKFIRRVLKKYQWSFTAARSVIDAYQQIQPLNEQELAVMGAALNFPQKFWRLSIRHFHNHGRHTPERSLEKFQKYLRNREAFDRFQREFGAYLAGEHS